MRTILSILSLVNCIVLIAVIVVQSGKNSGLSGAIGGGGGDTFLSKNKARSLDARLSRATKWIAALFIVLTLLLNLM